MTGDPVCNLPPGGWRCVRKGGHRGPCACVSARFLDGPLASRAEDRGAPALPWAVAALCFAVGYALASLIMAW